LNNKYFKKIMVKEESFYKKLPKDNNYDLIINCNQDNPLSKKYFVKTIDKDYKNLAYTTFIEHEELENNTATQVFTRSGPIAFLPISNTKTSVVCSINIKDKKYEEADILNLINKNNKKFKIKKILNLSKFKLKSSILRNYYYKNILAFGDLLHRIHPLAGQGFNMTIRDIKVFSEIIQKKIDLGIQLDTSILEEFEKKTKNKNFIFSTGIDFIYELFNLDKQIKNKNLNKIIEFLGNKKNFTNLIIKFADRGFSF
jgi:2-octaprenyl-6-methoxyphenol hydroxylase